MRNVVASDLKTATTSETGTNASADSFFTRSRKSWSAVYFTRYTSAIPNVAYPQRRLSPSRESPTHYSRLLDVVYRRPDALYPQLIRL